MREKTIYTLGILGTLLVLYNLYRIFLVIPDDALQGAMYRIIFFHVPAAIDGYLIFAVATIASLMFLLRKNFMYDAIAVSCIEVGTAYMLLNLVTGSIWGKVEWGVWWAWDVRLTSQLICFLLYLGYILLRSAVTEPTQRATMAAVLAIFAFADIPIVWYSIRWHNARTQHPSPVLETGKMAAVYWPSFLIGLVSLLMIGAAMVLVRLHQENSQREMDFVRRELHASA